MRHVARTTAIALATTLLAALSSGISAISQTPVTNAIGARICGADRLRGESNSDFNARMTAERAVPIWVWEAYNSLLSTPEVMSFSFKLNGQERILVASGAIDTDATKRLEVALEKYGPISEIWLNSPGGNSRVGLEIGRLIRRKMIATRIRAGNGCASACSSAFLGGVIREVEPGAVCGVTMYSSASAGQGVVASNEALWSGVAAATERQKYILEMGVSLKWLDLWSTTPPGCLTMMSQSELRSSVVDNTD